MTLPLVLVSKTVEADISLSDDRRVGHINAFLLIPFDPNGSLFSWFVSL